MSRTPRISWGGRVFKVNFLGSGKTKRLRKKRRSNINRLNHEFASAWRNPWGNASVVVAPLPVEPQGDTPREAVLGSVRENVEVAVDRAMPVSEPGEL